MEWRRGWIEKEQKQDLRRGSGAGCPFRGGVGGSPGGAAGGCCNGFRGWLVAVEACAE